MTIALVIAAVVCLFLGGNALRKKAAFAYTPAGERKAKAEFARQQREGTVSVSEPEFVQDWIQSNSPSLLKGLGLMALSFFLFAGSCVSALP